MLFPIIKRVNEDKQYFIYFNKIIQILKKNSANQGLKSYIEILIILLRLKNNNQSPISLLFKIFNY